MPFQLLSGNQVYVTKSSHIKDLGIHLGYLKPDARWEVVSHTSHQIAVLQLGIEIFQKSNLWSRKERFLEKI